MKISVYDDLDNILAEIGTRTQNYRVRMNMTQKDLALKSGVSLRTISAIESGKNASFENVIRILKTLNLESSLNSIVPESIEIVSVKKTVVKRRYRASKNVSSWKWNE